MILRLILAFASSRLRGSNIFLCILYAAAMVSCFSSAYAQESTAKPLTITADQTLEWRRAEKKFVALGAVRVTQDDVAINADVLTADYRETTSSPMSIDRLTAEGNVVISSQGNTATGDKAVYDVGSGAAVMTGQSLKLVSPDQTVTARDRFEYNAKAGRLSAVGDALAIRGEDSLRADRLSAVFIADANKARELKELTADGHVVITTPAETLHGDRGRYTAATQIAEIAGHVRIERGPNVLEGERAEVNLATNVSRLFGNPAEGGRVRGTFYPDSAEAKSPAPLPDAAKEGLTTP